ncbi:ATP synthase B/B' CF family protein [Ehrlichia chaffeensis str. Heartland]|uniref:ATP synthase F0, B' subunit n=1 Tax=Ehrlichia chaffeensis (strain ATCC CRL-10679 / Arkansas) TaxID=205920 RepID=Q2GFB0_EHRCR|nr:ATP synthase subunit B [Ehrlichia chaffeensis]ABD44700.1 ATP synthase F0, B' subunit [Ehrlichia chaffeensis str. Arkansas]AHX03264.1 ATP synthase B/B' CF family protein [Ehrlichia chaffeensis str. Heartland]AHX05181.1 ATP synthase B/B' CF family protein [Ehrlichia chaffeensis str. Jax]AHX06170.1 ATP synthase B/B' CF family protein [Ehrlichia chaffeensis str. Liberty]AHX07076.1 ATP synthase B/B' CF family protein [Ehrlichia chaffeensis str. Osceola]
MDTIPQLDITSYPSQLFWFFLSFGILYFLISKNIIPKLENVLKKRYTVTIDSVDCVENNLILAQDELKKQLSNLEEAKAEADRIISSALQEVKRTNADLIVLLNEEIQGMFSIADEYMHNLKRQTEQELIDLTCEIASMYYNKMLGTAEYVDKDKLRDITTRLYKEKI